MAEHSIDGGQAAMLAQNASTLLSNMRADGELLRLIPAKQKRELVEELRLMLSALGS
jgi:hypothetical protein